jgi:predicted porin
MRLKLIGIPAERAGKPTRILTSMSSKAALALALYLAVMAAAGAAPLAGVNPTSTANKELHQAARAISKEGPNESSFTFYGITVYGVVDIGLGYQSHGVRLADAFPPGLEYVVSKNSGPSMLTLAPNALSSSKIGVQGDEALTADISAIFAAETQFVPTSLRLADGPKTLAVKGENPASVQAFGDSNKAGQIFGGQAWLGLASKHYGTLTFGRQYSLFLDQVLAYDVMNASHAFSLIGYQGGAQAGASTEDARLDRSIKYAIKLEPFRLGALYAFGAPDRPTTHAYQFDLGYDLAPASIDITYGHINDSVSAAPLTPYQAAIAPRGAIAATVSDNNAFAAFAKYAVTPQIEATFGYEQIEYQNPGHPLSEGTHTIGGYVLAAIDNNAYALHRHLDYFWVGGRYAITPLTTVALTYYRSTQNSYAPVACGDSSLPSCSGQLQAVSAMALFRVTKYWEFYIGSMYSQASNGLASGYANRSTIDPVAGIRLSF